MLSNKVYQVDSINKFGNYQLEAEKAFEQGP